MAYKDTLCTNFIFRGKTRHRYGSEASSKFVPAEKGRDSIYVLSEGALEQEEVDYLIEAEQYKEDARLKRNEKSVTKERLEQVVEATRQAPRGKRAKTARELIEEGG